MHFLDRSAQTNHYRQIVATEKAISNAVDLNLNKTELEKFNQSKSQREFQPDNSPFFKEPEEIKPVIRKDSVFNIDFKVLGKEP